MGPQSTKLISELSSSFQIRVSAQEVSFLAPFAYKDDAFPVTWSKFPCGMWWGQTPSAFPSSEHPPCQGSRAPSSLPAQAVLLGLFPPGSMRAPAAPTTPLPHLSQHCGLPGSPVRSRFIPTRQEKLSVRTRWIFFVFFFSSSYSPAFLFPSSRKLRPSFPCIS